MMIVRWMGLVVDGRIGGRYIKLATCTVRHD